jgi:hypothetical protein
MESFRNPSSTTCFAGSSRVKMADGSHKKASAVLPGDKVETQSGEPATVTHVLETKLSDSDYGRAELMTCIGEDCYVTPYHPIFWGDKWRFPKNAIGVQYYLVSSVFNFALDGKDHTVIIGRIPCITLGHNITDDPVLEHTYFGTQAVIKDLDKLAEAQGSHKIVITPDYIRRDPVTNRICAISTAAPAVAAREVKDAKWGHWKSIEVESQWIPFCDAVEDSPDAFLELLSNPPADKFKCVVYCDLLRLASLSLEEAVKHLKESGAVWVYRSASVKQPKPGLHAVVIHFTRQTA